MDVEEINRLYVGFLLGVCFVTVMSRCSFLASAWMSLVSLVMCCALMLSLVSGDSSSLMFTILLVHILLYRVGFFFFRLSSGIRL